MEARTGHEVELRDVVRRHRWPDLITTHGGDPLQVVAAVAGLLRHFPARRRVRAMELASLIDHRLPAETPAQRSMNDALAATLRSSYHHAIAVRGLAPLGLGRPVVLTATPRSGNTLVQRIFHEVLDFPIVAAPTVADLDPDQLDSPVFIQTHAPHDAAVQAFVDGIGAAVVTIARHPLDVLISVLHFSRHEPQILDWLDGAAIASPETLAHATPTSDRFVDWACGPGATRLLSVTRSWWHRESTHRLRYEDLVADTPTVISDLVASLDMGPGLGLDDKLAATDLDQFRHGALAGLANHHRWRSRADGWRDLLTPPIVERVHQAHQGAFAELGYEVDGPVASAEAAETNWEEARR